MSRRIRLAAGHASRVMLVCLPVGACADRSEHDARSTARDSAAAMSVDTLHALRTDRAAYQWTIADSTYQVAIPITFHNESPDTIYIVNCNGQLPFGVERRYDDAWAPFWMAPTNACLSAPMVIEPGDTFRHTTGIAINLRNRDLPVGAGEDALVGEFRLVWHSIVKHYSTRPAFGDTLPLAVRRSNTFKLEKEAR
jgi:hypothetical protein